MQLTAVREERFENIVLTLDLFDGQLSLSDVLYQPMCYINNLIDAKMKVLDDRHKLATNEVSAKNSVGIDQAMDILKKSSGGSKIRLVDGSSRSLSRSAVPVVDAKRKGE